MSEPEEAPKPATVFARLARAKRTSSLGELFFLLRRTRKWWMLPVILLLLGFGVLMVLSASGVAPFIYTVF